MNSILNSIKQLLGIAADYTQFDVDIIIGINSAFMALNQLGIGPVSGFSISDSSTTWFSFLGAATNLEAVKSYVYMKTRLGFDPPTNSFVIDAINRQISELEWRLTIQAEGGTLI